MGIFYIKSNNQIKKNMNEKESQEFEPLERKHLDFNNKK